MNLFESPFAEILKLIDLLGQFSAFLFGTDPESATTLGLVVGVIVIIGIFVVLSLRGYLVVAKAVPIIWLLLAGAYLYHLSFVQDNNTAPATLVGFVVVAVLLILVIDHLRVQFWLGLLVGSIASQIGFAVDETLVTPALLLGTLIGVLLGYRFNETLEKRLDQLMMLATSFIAVLMLMGIIASFLPDYSLTMVQSCGLIIVWIGISLFMFSKQNEHRNRSLDKEIKASNEDLPDADRKPARQFKLSYITAVLIVIFLFVSGSIFLGDTENVQIPEPLGSFVTNFSDFTDKMSASKNLSYWVTAPDTIELRRCPRLDCPVGMVAQAGDPLYITNDGFDGDVQGYDWIEVSSRLQLFYVPAQIIAPLEVTPPLPSRSP